MNKFILALALTLSSNAFAEYHSYASEGFTLQQTESYLSALTSYRTLISNHFSNTPFNNTEMCKNTFDMDFFTNLNNYPESYQNQGISLLETLLDICK